MKLFFRILAYSKPYNSFIPLYLIVSILAVIFGILNFGILIPILDYLFKPENIVQPVDQLPTFTLSTNYFKSILDYTVYQFAGSDKSKALIALCFIVGVSVILNNLFKFLSQYILSNMRTLLVFKLKKDLYNKMMMLDMSYFVNNKKGNLLSVMSSDVFEIEHSIVVSIQSLLREPLVLISYFVFLFTLSTQLTWFLILYFPLVGIVISIIIKSLRKKSALLMQSQSDIMSMTDETISNIRIIKAFNNISFFTRKFEVENLNNRKLSRKVINKRELSSPFSEVLGVGAVIGLILYGGNLVLSGNGQLNGSQFLVYLFSFTMILVPAKSLTGAFSNIRKGMASCERICNLLDEKTYINNKPKAIEFKEFKKDIVFENVFFKYNNDLPDTLKNINLTINKGETIALVGSSGSGKSTLVDLIPRFYNITQGNILIDNILLNNYEIGFLRQSIGFVTQESILFNDSIYNNILFGRKGFTNEQVIEAAKIANAHDFILQLSNGYDTQIGDRGGKLSGGQKQRISIARAILANPNILILDEATSALDTESEQLVQEALTKIMQNRTCIIIAHRLTTIANANKIIVLQKGEIVEQGSHPELIKQNGAYKRLVDLQRTS